MADGNAWHLAEDDAPKVTQKPRNARSVSRTPSKGSNLPLEVHQEIVNIDNIELEAIGKEILEEEEARRRRSRSPAIDMMRKVSRQVINRIGHLNHKKPREFPLIRVRDAPTLDYDDFCARPKEFYREDKPFSFRELHHFKEEHKEPEKCAYLFRGVSYEAGPEALHVERLPEYDPFCPLHGSRRRIRRRNLVTMQSIMSSVEAEDDGEHTLPATIYNQEFIAKIIRKQKRAKMSDEERQRADKIMRKINSNLWIISFAFLFLFTAFHGLQNLQTSVNGDMGADSLIVLYIFTAFASLLVPSFMINRLGCKLTLITAMFAYMVYMVVNFRPNYYSLLPASALTGIAGACLWASKCSYITECGIRYARLNIESQNTVIVRFFGYFFMILHMGQVLGNLLSASILTAARPPRPPSDQVYKTCGHSFPQNASLLSPLAAENLQRPSEAAFMSVVATYLACTVVAVMIVSMFLNALYKDTQNRTKEPVCDTEVFQLFIRNFRSFKVSLLIPLTLFNGIEQAFIVGIYTKAFVGCGMGIAQIGRVATAFGICDAVCSLVFGPLIKLFGRMPLFVFGAVINMLMIVTLMVWSLNPTDTMLFYVVACVWGMADGVWNTQVNGYWIGLVGRQSLEFAFTSYRFWESLGLACGFFLIRTVSVEIFLFISFCLLLIGTIGYFIIEFYDKIAAYFTRLLSVVTSPRRKHGGTIRGKHPVSSMQASLITQSTMQTSIHTSQL